MDDFVKWENEFRKQNLFVFNNNDNALFWLKVRAVCRNRQIRRFIACNNLQIKSSRINDQYLEIYNILKKKPEAMEMLDHFLRQRNHEWYETLGVDEDKLKEDLYKIKYYSWGGDQNNSLDKYLVTHYVKTISDYERLEQSQATIGINAWNYVQTSWYNNWTSYLIESIFKRHDKVISAAGEIKSVDFFIDKFPIDLKVTFFPNQFMENKIKQKLGKTSLSWLKKQARGKGITVSSDHSKQEQEYILSEKLAELGYSNIMRKLNSVREEIVREARDNPAEIMEWLYSHQGEMRFGAENRIFLILVDPTDFTQSWKMKRAFSLIEPKINDYLNNFTTSTLKEVTFSFKSMKYRTLSDAIFVIKDDN